MLRTTIIAALALTAVPASAAEPTPGLRTARVHTADLDLSRKAGVEALDRRIEGAIRQVCPYSPGGDLSTLMAHRACARAATRSAEDSRATVIAQARLDALEAVTAAR